MVTSYRMKEEEVTINMDLFLFIIPCLVLKELTWEQYSYQSEMISVQLSIFLFRLLLSNKAVFTNF